MARALVRECRATMTLSSITGNDLHWRSRPTSAAKRNGPGAVFFPRPGRAAPEGRTGEPVRARSVSAGRDLARSRAPEPEGRNEKLDYVHLRCDSAALGWAEDGHHAQQPGCLRDHRMGKACGGTVPFWAWLIIATSMSVHRRCRARRPSSVGAHLALAAGAALVAPWCCWPLRIPSRCWWVPVPVARPIGALLQ
jgi:hypothetical protein